jgi:hypothetical protein
MRKEKTMVDIKKEIEERIALAFKTPTIEAAVAKNMQAQKDLSEVESMRNDCLRKIEGLKDEVTKYDAAFKKISHMILWISIPPYCHPLWPRRAKQPRLLVLCRWNLLRQSGCGAMIKSKSWLMK